MKRKSPVMAVALAGLFMYTSCSPTEQAETKDYTQYVNTFIGAADNGHTFPGACYPFGMIQTSPVTGAVGWRYCSEYTYQDSLIWGFTQTHLNGTGCMDLGDILVMPVTYQFRQEALRCEPLSGKRDYCHGRGTARSTQRKPPSCSSGSIR